MPYHIVLASGNSGKIRELQAGLTPLGLSVRSQNEYDFPEAIEDGLSFVENAIIKARHACKHTGLPAIADDSGLEVTALNGAPGIYSARFAGKHANDSDNNNKLLAALKNETQRQARFHCALVFMRHADDPTPIICQGVWEGEILQRAQGDNGFGYDPLFYVANEGVSSAQLAPETKQKLSHRAKAIAQLITALSQTHMT